MRAVTIAALAALATAATAGAAAGAGRPTFSGSCQFSGTIHPEPPITVLPHASPRFSYVGVGTCTSTAPRRRVPLRVIFRHAATPFDTCELGLDVGISGSMRVGAGRRAITFPITVDLLRAALAGPLRLTAAGGGEALGAAQFTPPSSTGAITECGGSGVSSATLSASFSTLQPLVGR